MMDRQGRPLKTDAREALESAAQASADAQAEGGEHDSALERLSARLRTPDSAGQLFALEGMSAEQVHRQLPGLRDVLGQHNGIVLTLDPSGQLSAQVQLDAVLSVYLEEVSRRGLTSQTIEELVEWMTFMRAEASEQSSFAVGRASGYRQAMGQLFTALSRVLPAALFLFNADLLDAQSLKQLKELLSFHFADPIAALSPEIESADRSRARLVLVQPTDGDSIAALLGLDDDQLEHIDGSSSSTRAVRDFLSKDEVITRFWASTGGDPERLEELVDTLPQNVESFWLHRYRALGPLERSIVDALAVAGQPLKAELAQPIMEALGMRGYLTRTLKTLQNTGFLQRKVSAGQIELQLANSHFARAVAARLDETVAQSYHLALAEAVSARADADSQSLFLSKHFLAAGDRERGLAYGQSAVERLIAQRQLEQARDLLVDLLAACQAREDRKAYHHKMVDIASALGDSRLALRHCGLLKPLTETDAELAELRLRIGLLLLHLSEFETALSILERVDHEALETAMGLELLLGRGEALLSLGRHDEAAQIARQSLGCCDDEALPEHRADALSVRARNLLGKIAIFTTDYVRARELFEKNAALADDWGWDKELARAKANLGVVALQTRDFTTALERLEEALSSSRQQGMLSRARCLFNLANVNHQLHRYSLALEHYLEALRLAKHSDDWVVYSFTGHNLASLYHSMGVFGRGVEIYEHLGEHERVQRINVTRWWTDIGLGLLALDRGEPREAIEHFQRLEQADPQSAVLHQVEARLWSAQAHLALDQLEAARTIASRVRLEELPPGRERLGVLDHLLRGQLDLASENFEEALPELMQAQAMANKHGFDREIIQATTATVRCLLVLERSNEADSLIEQALQTIVARSGQIPKQYRHHYFARPLLIELATLAEQRSLRLPDPLEIELRSARQRDQIERAELLRVDEEAVDPRSTAEWQAWRARYAKIIGDTEKLHQNFRIIDRVAASDTTILLLGESGTGKELFAESIHRRSPRGKGPLVKVNCAAFVEELLLSELFGHEKGAFTGANSQKQGRFELADGGTLFLDEIGDISAKTQVALLRVLQDKRFERVGGTETLDCDVRVVCATNKNLEEMVRRGSFRLDLYYRLKGVVIEVPSLRERRADIPLLVEHFARSYADGQGAKQFAPQALQFLASYSWPGNIRELQNFVRSILLFVEGSIVTLDEIREFEDFFASGQFDPDLPAIELPRPPAPLPIGEEAPAQPEETIATLAMAGVDPESALVARIIAQDDSLNELKDRLELECIKRALTETGGNVTQAARILQMKRPRLSQIINGDPVLAELKAQLVG